MKEYLTKEEQTRLYHELLEHVDYPLETYFDKSFVELIGKIGGDCIKVRAYLTVDNEIKIFEK